MLQEGRNYFFGIDDPLVEQETERLFFVYIPIEKTEGV